MSLSKNYELQFLESPSNLTDVLKKNLGREPSAKVSSDIAACIQQGRMFFDAAENSPLQIRPLQLYYGVVSFAKAITLATSLRAADTLARAHGLRDNSAQGSTISDLTLKINGKGTFQEVTDAIAPLGGLRTYEGSNPQWIPKPFDNWKSIEDISVSLVDLIARIPGLDELFEKTFHRKALSIGVEFLFSYNNEIDLRIWDNTPVRNHNELVSLVQRLRTDFPFLSLWRFTSSERHWNKTVLSFTNAKVGDDLTPESLLATDESIIGKPFSSAERSQLEDIIPPLAGGLSSGTAVALAPLSGIYLPEQSLEFCVCFLLSALVRYRPQTWQFAISRSRVEGTPADDRALSLINLFIERTMSDYPQTLINIVEGKRG